VAAGDAAGGLTAAPTAAADAPEFLSARVGQLERELRRMRRSRRVLMDLLWRLDRDWRERLSTLEAENRRLWALRRPQGQA
jgi:hypothetical protein